MVVNINSAAISGVEGYIVSVEADIGRGMPSFEVVGLPDSAVKESRERVKSAIKNSGFEFPVRHITINLAPADIRKEGPSFDLPIALAILAASGLIPSEKLGNCFFTGELSLDGSIKPVKGVLSMVHKAFLSGMERFIVPKDNHEEAALIEGANVFSFDSLAQIISAIKNNTLKTESILKESKAYEESAVIPLDFADVKGQQNVKRAIEIAASGYHNIIMIGPPGSGKTMMAKRIPYIMPPLKFDESIEVTKIYSVSGLLDYKNALVRDRPFRAPHHTISYSAMTGGGIKSRPGEISLAHKGVLFLDELPEFHRNVLEILRQPLEDKTVTVSRASFAVSYPCDFMFAAAMNPCPCGNLFSGGSCACTPNEISKYLGKISGPLLDRIDIQAETSKIDYNDLRYNRGKAESSEDIRKRVLRTLKIQEKRYRTESICYNSQLSAPMIEKYCPIDNASHELLKQAFDSLNLSVRAYHKILKVARTIADIDEAENIEVLHISEAIGYRSLDRKYWN